MRTTINKVLFISPESACKAILRQSLAWGVSPSVILQKGRAEAVYRRGELLGYSAICPKADGSVSAILEAEN